MGIITTLSYACLHYCLYRTGMLDFSGVVQSSLRAWFGWQAQDYFEIRSRV